MSRNRLSLPLSLLLLVSLATLAVAAPPVRTLIQGAPIQGTNGIAVGPDGNLYVTSVEGREIVVMVV